MAERAGAITEEAWREITVAEGSQGPRSYLFSAQRVRPTSRRKPGEIHWAVYRRNLDGSEPRYYLSNAPEDTPLETLARIPLAIETEFETEKRTWGWTSTKPALAGITTWPCALAGACSRLGGKKMPRITRPQAGGAGDAAPGTVRT